MYGHATAAGDVNGDGWIDLFVGHFADRPDARVPRAWSHRSRARSAAARRARRVPDRRDVPRGPRAHERSRLRRPRRRRRPRPRDRAQRQRPHRVGQHAVGRAAQRRWPLRAGGPSSTTGSPADRSASSTTTPTAVSTSFLVEDRFAGGSSALYRNVGDFEFDDVTTAAGLPRDLDGLGVATADLDGDARPDLFVAGSNRLFVNVDGRALRARSTRDEFRWRTYGDEDDPAGVAAGDVDGDGRLDLVLGQHFNSTIDEGPRVPVRLYLNEATSRGRPRFRDVTEAAGLVGLPTKAPHVELVDFDADGRLDLLTTASADGGSRPAVFRGVGVEDGVPRFEPPDGLGERRSTG